MRTLFYVDVITGTYGDAHDIAFVELDDAQVDSLIEDEMTEGDLVALAENVGIYPATETFYCI